MDYAGGSDRVGIKSFLGLLTFEWVFVAHQNPPGDTPTNIRGSDCVTLYTLKNYHVTESVLKRLLEVNINKKGGCCFMQLHLYCITLYRLSVFHVPLYKFKLDATTINTDFSCFPFIIEFTYKVL